MLTFFMQNKKLLSAILKVNTGLVYLIYKSMGYFK